MSSFDKKFSRDHPNFLTQDSVDCCFARLSATAIIEVETRDRVQVNGGSTVNCGACSLLLENDRYSFTRLFYSVFHVLTMT